MSVEFKHPENGKNRRRNGYEWKEEACLRMKDQNKECENHGDYAKGKHCIILRKEEKKKEGGGERRACKLKVSSDRLLGRLKG